MFQRSHVRGQETGKSQQNLKWGKGSIRTELEAGGVAFGGARDFGSRLFSDSHGDGEMTLGHFDSGRGGRKHRGRAFVGGACIAYAMSPSMARLP